MTDQKKISTNINMFKFKDYKGQKDFNAKIEPIVVKKEKILKAILQKSSRTKYFCEWIEGDAKIKPFYDIDIWCPKCMDDWGELAKGVQQQYISKFQELYPKGEIAVASSHGFKQKKDPIDGTMKDGNAISFHMVVNNYETTIPELKKFNELHKVYDDAVDKSVYRSKGNIRSLHSNKPDGDRTFIPENYQEDLFKHCIQSSNWTNIETPIQLSSPPVSPLQTDSDEDYVPEKELAEDDTEEADNDMLPPSVRMMNAS